jgi:hypothetical protein
MGDFVRDLGKREKGGASSKQSRGEQWLVGVKSSQGWRRQIPVSPLAAGLRTGYQQLVHAPYVLSPAQPRAPSPAVDTLASRG